MWHCGWSPYWSGSQWTLTASQPNHHAHLACRVIVQISTSPHSFRAVRKKFKMSSQFDPVKDAFEKAVHEFKKNLKDPVTYQKILQVTTIRQVYEETSELQKQQAKDGKLRNLKRIEPYLKRLENYSAAVDKFVQVKPDVLALIWGPIVLLLQWANVLMTAFDAIVDTIAEIGNALPRFEQGAQLFGDKDCIKELLLLFFKDILGFYKAAFDFFRLSREKFVPPMVSVSALT